MADQRLNRQFWTLTQLREGGVLGAQDIADEHGVSLRTIYRDIEGLLAHGLPIRGVPGPEGGYSLEGAEELDPLIFRSADSLGAYLRSPHDPARSEALWRKIEIASIIDDSGLEPDDSALRQAIASRIHFDKSDWYWRNEPPAVLPELRRALFSDAAVRIEYVPRGGTESRELTVLPYGLVWKSGSWYLVAAGDDGGISRYRLERIRGVQRTGQRYDRPEDFDLATWWDEETHRYGQGDVRVELEVSAGATDEFLRLDLKESSRVARNRDGSAQVTLFVDRWEWLVPLVASYAGEVVVTEPDGLHRAIIDHFERGLRAFGAGKPREKRGMTASASVRVPVGTRPVPEEAFAFARDHYNIYPWVRDGDHLLRVLDVGGLAVIAAIDPPDAAWRLAAGLTADRPLEPAEVERASRTLAFCLAADESDPLPGLAAGDPVLTAALSVNQGIRPKRYPDLFEAICGAICAQNVDFRRLYSMMRNLAVAFGRPVARGDGVEHAFPTADLVAAAGPEELNACRVGYRAKGIQAAARWFVEHGAELSRNELRSLPMADAVERLLPIPSIGPYSAAIVLAVGAGRGDIFHLDSFTRTIMREFYFDGREAGDDELRALALDRWGPNAGSVAHLLTTNTERWADLLGRPDFRRSGARRG